MKLSNILPHIDFQHISTIGAALLASGKNHQEAAAHLVDLLDVLTDDIALAAIPAPWGEMVALADRPIYSLVATAIVRSLPAPQPA